MQRIEQLRPLSRQHHLGLNLGLKASQFPNSATEVQINEQWEVLNAFINDELTSHFGVEEDYLVKPLITEHQDDAEVKKLSEILIQQHQTLKNLLAKPSPNIDDLHELGQTLYDHIRFEEREVFPIAQRLLTQEQLNTLYEQSGEDVKTK